VETDSCAGAPTESVRSKVASAAWSGAVAKAAAATTAIHNCFFILLLDRFPSAAKAAN
jgi:hypothetical protein